MFRGMIMHKERNQKKKKNDQVMWGQAKELQLDTLVHYFTYSYDFGRMSLLCLKD